MKVFHFGDKLDVLPRESGEIAAPIHIRIKPTNVCAHSCWYCAYKDEGLQLGKDMVTRDSIPREKMLEIIEDIVEMGVEAVTFSGGGDPFYYPHLLEAVTALSKTRVRFASLTNGARLHRELAEVFAEYGTWVRISIDGWDAKSYSEYRRVSETEFDKVVGNMAAFKKLGGGCLLGVSYIIDQKNASHVFEFAQRMKDIGVDSVKMSPCIVSNDGVESNRYHAEVFSLVEEQIARASEELAGDGFEIKNDYHPLDEWFDKDYTWCPFLQLLPVIGADLNVYACQDKAYSIPDGLLGSIGDKRFKDFWFSGKEKFFAINPSVHCRHHCVANPKNRLIVDYLGADRDHLSFV